MKNSARSKIQPGPAPKSLSIHECALFWAGVEVSEPSSCWLWQKARLRASGYGVVRLHRKNYAAHRIAHFLKTGEWPEVVRHRCDVRACCNPRHLLGGTHQDNCDDRMQRSSNVRGEGLPQSKLTEEQVRAIRADKRSGLVIARDYGISNSLVCQVKRRQVWRHVD